uniref:Uncharacterized protein n=1 Tax=Cucumis sativus TaxID=3659 RepID=A0A0A0LDR7_CUCSA
MIRKQELRTTENFVNRITNFVQSANTQACGGDEPESQKENQLKNWSSEQLRDWQRRRRGFERLRNARFSMNESDAVELPMSLSG